MPRVLIVDHDRNQRRALALGLLLEGFDVLEAANPEEASRLLSASPPIDAAVVELMVLSLEGLELAREIHRRYAGARIALSSVYHLSEQQLERTKCGATAFLPKPYDAQAAVKMLRSKDTVAA